MKKRKKNRVIIDTNLWIHFLISKKYDLLSQIILEKECKLIFSKELLEEFLSVIERPKFKKFFNRKDVEFLLEIINQAMELVEITDDVEICRDPKDNFLLSLCKDSKADYLITGDNDLLELNIFEKVKIITLNNFLELN